MATHLYSMHILSKTKDIIYMITTWVARIIYTPLNNNIIINQGVRLYKAIHTIRSRIPNYPLKTTYRNNLTLMTLISLINLNLIKGKKKKDKEVCSLYKGIEMLNSFMWV